MEQNTKRCPRCEEVKSWDEVHWEHRRDAPGSYCRTCKATYRRERYLWKTPQHPTECKQCGAWLEPPKRSSRPKIFCSKQCRSDWHNANQTREYRRDSLLRNTFGISLDDYNRMLAEIDGRCPLCGCTEAESRNDVFDVDHCHNTDKVRGLLCHRCNWALGILGDNPTLLRRAADYLEAVASA